MVNVDIINVLPCAVENVIPFTYKFEPDMVDTIIEFVWSVENSRVPPFIVEPTNVDTITLFPCAVENVRFDVDRLATFVPFIVMVLPVSVETMILVPFILEPIVVDWIDITFTVIVLPKSVDT